MQSSILFSEFVEFIREHLLDGWQNDREIKIQEIRKNNGTVLTALTLPREGQTLLPTFYLESFYEDYQEGLSLEDILCKIREAYLQAEESIPDMDAERILSYDAVKDNIIFRLIHYEKNKELLESCPHLRVHDLAVTFRIIVSLDHISLSTTLVTYDQMEMWNITMSELLVRAEENTREWMPPIIRPMDFFLEEDWEDESEIPFYYATNPKMLYGATVLLYDGFFQSFAEDIDSDFYVIPSSIHELILLPDYMEPDVEHLKIMVSEINRTMVEEEDVLSDSVYHYNRKENVLTCCGAA